MQYQLSTSGQFIVSIFINSNRECTTSGTFPSVLVFIIHRFGDNLNFLSNQISTVKTDTELTNHGNIGTAWQSFHKGFGSGFGDGSQIVDQFLFGHTDTGIPDCQSVVLFVGDDSDSEIGFGGLSGSFGVGDGFVSDFV